MEPNIETRLEAQEQKIDAIFESVKKTEKYFKVTLWVTVIAVVLPFVILIFVLPIVMKSYLSTIGGLL